MHTKFVIVGLARTGSSFVTNSLYGHKDILMHGEPFQTENLDWHIRAEVLPEIDLTQRDTAPIEFINHFYELNHGYAYVGAKILYGQNDVALEAVCRNPSFMKIFIRRANLLANYSSFLLAEKTNVWNAHEDEFIDRKSAKVVFDPDGFREFLHWEEGRANDLLRIAEADSGQWLMIFYSSHNMKDQVNKVRDFLGVDRTDSIYSSLKRFNTNIILDRFENPQDVEATLAAIGHPEWRAE